jgi:hypothetical protein
MDYTPDNAALKGKKAEIQKLLLTFTETHVSLEPSDAETLIETFVTLTAPLDPPVVIRYITIGDLGKGGGSSRKPGNVTLNWKNLFELVPDITLAGAGAVGVPWLIPFAALYIWMKLWKTTEINLTEEDAFVIYSLWTHRDAGKKIPENEAFLKTEALAKRHGIPLTKKRFTEIISKLLALECIELDSGVIWLREWVRVKY